MRRDRVPHPSPMLQPKPMNRFRRDGAILEPFIDTIIICFLTGMVPYHQVYGMKNLQSVPANRYRNSGRLLSRTTMKKNLAALKNHLNNRIRYPSSQGKFR
jgi:hypothetical protein